MEEVLHNSPRVPEITVINSRHFLRDY
ncbi:uncharacterized protein G2W53_012227 [Senna tora]|uniref:Uncharacterized protein n=1 Tax=Senna tora TaxID=362788 RepID=A0A834WSI8_9FABA|nr:uncharacterized protein G2W53_012227 [Senna tora]